MEHFLQSYIVPITILIGFTAQAFVQWRININKAGFEGIDQYKKVVEAYEKRIELMALEIKKLQESIVEQGKEIRGLHVQIEEKDKRLSEYLEILREKDPDSKVVVQAAKEMIVFMVDQKKEVAEIRNLLSQKL